MTYFILIPIFVGLCCGVLVNYLGDVLPVTRQFSQPTCPKCGHERGVSDYLLFKPCRACGQPRSLRTWLTIILMVAASVYLWLRIPDYALSIIVTTYFGLIAVIDIEHRLILHPTSIFGVLLGLGIGWLKHGIVTTLIGGLVGFLIMFALYYLGVLFTRYRARRMEKAGLQPDDEEALGFGDVALATVLGLLMGLPRIWFCLLQGILFAGIFGFLTVVFMLIIRRYKENALMIFMPYGPFLILSAFLTLFVPNWIALIVPK